MKIRCLLFIALGLSAIGLLVSVPGTRTVSARGSEDGLEAAVTLTAPLTADETEDEVITLPADQLRQYALHNSGRLYSHIGCGTFPPTFYVRDPETNEGAGTAYFPNGSNLAIIWGGGLWIGGIVGQDTLVSTAFDPWYNFGGSEFWPPDPDSGGFIRRGDFADDEFVATFTDTVTDPYYAGYPNNYDDRSHIPLGLKITQSSYSWADTVYDDFIIIDYVLENILDQTIDDGFVGLYLDPDIYDLTDNGFSDDFSGAIDTLLYADDPSSRVLIAYSTDNNGDPVSNLGWDNSSVRGAVSVRLLETSIESPVINFNWWRSATLAENDYGPRRLGTPEDPLRIFAGGVLGTPNSQEDKYYLLSHPEVDYVQMRAPVIDSSDGWIPPPNTQGIAFADTRFVYSFGPFTLAPGETMTFAVAIVATDSMHVYPSDYVTYFDPANPDAYLERLSLSQLLRAHRRVDSVYASGMTLPAPGPPVGLRIVEYDDNQVTLTWHPSGHPDLAGYFVQVKDTVFYDSWRHVSPTPISDTLFTVPITYPLHEQFFTVSMVDTRGRESARSFRVSVVPSLPHPPREVAVVLDDMTPELSWLATGEPGLEAYLIYRSTWRGDYALHDSTLGLSYRDTDTESGVRYNYRVSARNDDGLESALSEVVSALPMAFDKGVLYFDLNYNSTVQTGPYKKAYTDVILSDIASDIPVDRYDVEDGYISFRLMSHYPVIIVDAEKGGGKFDLFAIDSIRVFLENGGKVLFISPNASTSSVGISRPRVINHEEDNFFGNLLRLDSVIVNGFAFTAGTIFGDLMGCLPEVVDYPEVSADLAKLLVAPLPIEGYIPLSGCVFPRLDEVDVLYRYQSLYTDSMLHNQVNGYRYANDTYSFVFYNFALSLMSRPAATLALRRGLMELGVITGCGDYNDDGCINVSDAVAFINYLYRDGAPPSIPWRADVDCDGEVGMGDVVTIINRVFKNGAHLSCCH